MSCLTVIGIGNSLYGDDGIGNEVVRTLSEKNTDERIQYLIAETDIDYCISQIQAPFVIIVDAVQTGNQPGSVWTIPLTSMSVPNISGITMHDQHLLTIIRDCNTKGYLVAIEPDDLSFRVGLSESLKRDFDNITNSINDIIMRL